MKSEIIIIVVSIFVILGIGFFVFTLQQSGFTNFAIYNDSSGNSVISSQNLNGSVTKEDASQAINDSEEILQGMKNNNLSIAYVNDLLIEAKNAFNSTDYNDVLNYTGQIRLREEEGFQIYDTLTVIEIDLEKYEKEGINLSQSRDLLEEAKTAFYEDRYSDSENLLKQTRNSIDSTVSENSLLNDLRKNTVNFIQRDWYYLLIVLFLLSIIIFLSHKKIKSNLLKKKIRKMKAEKIALNELMKKAQTERFKENKISGLTYNLRIKKYKEKIAEIDEELPVLEKRLKPEKDLKSKRK